LIPYRPDQVRQAITSRIRALTASSLYAGENDAWRESLDPLVQEWDPNTRAHLNFFVDDRDIDINELTRGTVSRGDAPYIDSQIVVRYLFNLPPKNRVNAWDASMISATHLTSWLIEESWQDEIHVFLDRRPITRIPLDVQDWIAVECRYRVNYFWALGALAT